MRVLYIEDNPRDAKLCIGYLERSNFAIEAEVVGSYEEFVGALHSGSYDVILADF